MNFSNLISRDNWALHYQKTLCDLHIHNSHKSNNTNKSNVPNPVQRYSIKLPIEEMDFPVKSPPLANTPHPPHGVYLDRCISKVLLFSLSLAFLTSLRNFFHRIKWAKTLFFWSEASGISLDLPEAIFTTKVKLKNSGKIKNSICRVWSQMKATFMSQFGHLTNTQGSFVS